MATPNADTYLASAAFELASNYGLVLDPWQRGVNDDWLAELADGRYAHTSCGLAVPRQNGKNVNIEVRELFGAIGKGERILHTAHEVKTARKAFKRLQFFFGISRNDPGARFPELNALVVELRSVNGQEAIVLRNGGSIEIIARTKNSGRGFTADVLVIDEAQEMAEEDLEALLPTTSAAPLGNPQWIWTGTPPGPNASGVVFSRQRAAALGPAPVRRTWSEWSPPIDDLSDIDLDDRELWYRYNPALGRRLLMDVVEAERSTFSDEGFARERLGWWRPQIAGGGAIDRELWEALAAPVLERGTPVAWGVATAPDREWAAVAVAWTRPDGDHQVQLVEYRRTATWVSDRVDELRNKWGGEVFVDQASQGLVANAENVSQATRAIADNAFSDATLAKTVRHNSDRALDVAVGAAAWKPYVDTRVFERKNSLDISPLIAAALALHGIAKTADPWVAWDDDE